MYGFDKTNEDSVNQHVPPSLGAWTPTTPPLWTPCCTQTLFDLNQCSSLNSPILNSFPYYHHTQPLSVSNTSVTYSIHSPPKNLYTTIMFSCTSTPSETILGTGSISITSNGSLLPIYLTLTYYTYLTLTIFTSIISLMYILNVVNGKSLDVLLLHKFLTPLPLIGTTSLTLLTVYYHIYSSSGIVEPSIKYTSIASMSVYKVWLRVAVLVVCDGYCVAKRELEKRTVCLIFFLSLSGGVSTLAFDILDFNSTTLGLQSSDTVKTFLQLFGLGFNVAVYWLIVEKLNGTMKYLEDNRQGEKLKVYYWFSNVLFSSVVIVGITVTCNVVVQVLLRYGWVEIYDTILFQWILDRGVYEALQVLVLGATLWGWRVKRGMGMLAEVVQIANESDEEWDGSFDVEEGGIQMQEVEVEGGEGEEGGGRKGFDMNAMRDLADSDDEDE
ncbi:hypothetical protein TrVE_jg1709 [Triparma verrucosa]|uniref:GOST seven transmembrane domain-containing protein n=1 Tax=Triparma verrucosa TaxID=1606542 RepID=A0A9W7EQ02_9STRA|nr:hypothetical protein TrVE_jg1709 [Triparma verrucosa]